MTIIMYLQLTKCNKNQIPFFVPFVATSFNFCPSRVALSTFTVPPVFITIKIKINSYTAILHCQDHGDFFDPNSLFLRNDITNTQLILLHQFAFSTPPLHHQLATNPFNHIYNPHITH